MVPRSRSQTFLTFLSPSKDEDADVRFPNSVYGNNVKTSLDAEANSNVQCIRWHFSEGWLYDFESRNTYKRAAAPQHATHPRFRRSCVAHVSLMCRKSPFILPDIGWRVDSCDLTSGQRSTAQRISGIRRAPTLIACICTNSARRKTDSQRKRFSSDLSLPLRYPRAPLL